MTSSQANQQEDNYFRFILHDSPDITPRELAEKLGVSGLNYCLKVLMDKGCVKNQKFSNNK